MAHYWLSFSLDDRPVHGRDYGTRWNSLYETVHEIAEVCWQETTMSIVFSSLLDIDNVVRLIKKAVDKNFDIVLLKDLDSGETQIFGPITDHDIFHLIPNLKKA